MPGEDAGEQARHVGRCRALLRRAVPQAGLLVGTGEVGPLHAGMDEPAATAGLAAVAVVLSLSRMSIPDVSPVKRLAAVPLKISFPPEVMVTFSLSHRSSAVLKRRSFSFSCVHLSAFSVNAVAPTVPVFANTRSTPTD